MADNTAAAQEAMNHTAMTHAATARNAAPGAGLAHGFQDADDVLPTYHIEAQTSLVERPLRSLKFGEAFGVLDFYGDIGVQPGPEGLYFQDTRYLSRLEVTVEGQRPLMLSSVMQDDNGALSVDMTTPTSASTPTTRPRSPARRSRSSAPISCSAAPATTGSACARSIPSTAACASP